VKENLKIVAKNPTRLMKNAIPYLPLASRNIQNEMKNFPKNYNTTNSSNPTAEVKTRNPIKPFLTQQHKMPIFPLNKVNLDPLKLDLPPSEKLKILKKENKFLFEITQEEKKAAEQLRSYIDNQCDEYREEI